MLRSLIHAYLESPRDNKLTMTVVRQDARVYRWLPYRHAETGVVLVSPRGASAPSVTGSGLGVLVVALRGPACPLDLENTAHVSTVPHAEQACRRIRKAIRALREEVADALR